MSDIMDRIQKKVRDNAHAPVQVRTPPLILAISQLTSVMGHNAACRVHLRHTVDVRE
jgi:hypothetical protein